RFELSVGDRGLGDCWQLVRIAEGAQINQQAMNVLRWGWHKLCLARAVIATADPILSVTNDTAMSFEPRARDQAPVNFAKVIDIDVLFRANRVHRPVHGVDVAENFFRGHIARTFAKGASRLGVEESPTSNLETLNL